jgi:hypothetical protein
MGDDRLVVFRYSGQGFVPAVMDARPLQDVSAITLLGQQIAEKHPVVTGWRLGSPADVPLDELTSGVGDYTSGRHLGLESIYPVAQGYKDFAGPGLRLNLSDPIQLHRASLTVSYTPDRDLPAGERVHAMAEYHRMGLHARARYNPADFYDLFGPTKNSRKGHSFGLGYEKTFLYDVPRQASFSIDADYWGGLERLPDFQNVAVPVETLFASRARLDYRNVRSSLGHVDDEKGVEWSLVLDQDLVEGKGYFRGHAELDLGLALPLGHSSVWLRSSAGWSPSDRDQPYSNFFFGGFGNNWVDRGTEKRYREYYSFPGLELNEVGGTGYLKSMLEWNLPPLRFRRAGSPGFYLTLARPALFATGLVLEPGEAALRRSLASVGAQVDLQFTLLSALDMTLSAGYAVAFEDGLGARREAMVSLKVLK